MPKFVKNQSKPNKNKNFFQNYGDHLDFMENGDRKIIDKIVNASPREQLNIIGEEALKRLLILDALRDGYDYMDEVAGATAVPFASGLASICLAGMAIWEGAQALAIATGLKNDDKEEHLSNAGQDLLWAGATAALAIASFFKSLISLISRPIVTLIQGWKPQDADRFAIDNSIVGSLSC